MGPPLHLPRFEVAARHRPIAVVGEAAVAESWDSTPPSAGRARTPHVAPFAAIEVGLGPDGGTTAAELSGEDGTLLQVRLDGDRVSLAVTAAGTTSEHRSRRHGRARAGRSRLGLALTGSWLTALVLEHDGWRVRGRVDLDHPDLRGVLDVGDPAWLAGLSSGWTSTAPVTGWTAGSFGQLGLRDLRVVSLADGTPYRIPEGLLLTATSAGPGTFSTAHTSVWLLAHDGGLRHRGDLFFRRPDRAGVFGDHATHLVRDDGRWLVATSTWADFPADRRDHATASVGVTLAESTDDLTRGQHVLSTRALDLPTDGTSVGVWDPHLVRQPDGAWLVGYVSARRFFDFHPVLAAGPSLDALVLRGAATDRRATEGTTIARIGGQWRVLASDGRDNRRAVRGRFPVFDLDLAEVGTLDAPYPSNIPWPSVVPPDPGSPGDGWLLVTFDGAPAGGPSAGYGTHGDVVVMSEAGPIAKNGREGRPA